MDNGTEDAVAAVAASYKGFDPAAYLQYNYTPPRADFERKDSIVPWKLGCLHRALAEGDVSGEVLVDIGSGPTLWQTMSGCEVFNKVLLTEYLEVNRQELRRWLQDTGDCSLDWSPYLQHVCKLEGRDLSEWTEKAARMRRVITDVLHVDVHNPQPVAADALPKDGADCLVSSFCLESVSPTLATFTRALGHIRKLLRPKGHLLLIGALGESYYLAGPGAKIPVVPLTEAEVCTSLKESGFTLIRLEVYVLPSDMRVGVDDVTGVFFAKAQNE
ncbi:phenylethanolamine N-methyltransferase-like [Genypterus blacodes]|uniref:phenylethanolamine N-methyltransferase-like n=1 Tax=Genypterus blacodes TaxID=154954 RepID=UPI003F7676C7